MLDEHNEHSYYNACVIITIINHPDHEVMIDTFVCP